MIGLTLLRKKISVARRKLLRFIWKKSYATGKPIEIERRFTSVYKWNTWGSEESRSGSGSTLDSTTKIRKELPHLFDRYGVQTVFDGACGDFNWMRHVLAGTDVNYTGGDIVKPLIRKLSKFESPKIKFIHFDLVQQVPPQADLMILRDVLFHLSFADTKMVLENYLASGTPLLLTTTYDSTSTVFENRDIQTGYFRLIDLFSRPYSFSRAPLETLEDWSAPDPRRYLCLWERPSIDAALRQWTN